MSTAETLIVFLLLIIAYFLYQIARQLSYLTGVRITLPFSNVQWVVHKRVRKVLDKKSNNNDSLPN